MFARCDKGTVPIPEGLLRQERSRRISETSSRTRIPKFVQEWPAGAAKKSSSFVQRMSTSGIKAVCIRRHRLHRGWRQLREDRDRRFRPNREEAMRNCKRGSRRGRRILGALGKRSTLASSWSISFERTNVCSLARIVRSSSRATPTACSLARTRIVASRTTFTDADDI
jgi:hypothetical protein